MPDDDIRELRTDIRGIYTELKAVRAEAADNGKITARIEEHLRTLNGKVLANQDSIKERKKESADLDNRVDIIDKEIANQKVWNRVWNAIAGFMGAIAGSVITWLITSKIL